MSVDNRFTEDEQFILINTPYIIGAAMIFVGGSGLGTVKELYSNAKSFLEGAKKFPNNKIITGILPDMEDWKEVRKETKVFQEKSTEIFKEKNIDNAEKMQTFAQEEAMKVLKILEEKATKEETKEYKEWILSIAENVARAAKEGGFLGFGGERVSADEKVFYAKVANVLGVSTDLV
jgi:hypothetical protein